MALLDIVVEGYQVEVEEYRGDIGTITDMVIDNENAAIVEIPSGGGGGFEYGFGFIG